MALHPDESCTFTDSSGVRFDYTRIKQIGRGSFGSVVEATETTNGNPTGRPIAVKQVYYPEFSVTLLKSVNEKLQRIRFIKSPNVTEYCHVKAEEINEGFEPTILTTVITEYCTAGNLDCYAKRTNLSNGQINDFIVQILTGLVAIHSHKVIHMDLKTANIVLAHDKSSRYGLTAKITDLDDHFPLSASSTTSDEVVNGKATLLFMSPEAMVGGTKGYNIGRKTDIWSMGCIIVELYRRGNDLRFVRTINQRPSPADALVIQSDTHPEAIRSFVVDGGVPEMPMDIPDIVRTITEKCFQTNPKERPDAADMIHNGWFESVCHRNETLVRTTSEFSRQEFMLRNQNLVPQREHDHRDLFWDVGLNCAARVLVHHIPHTRFPYQYYEAEIAHIKNIEPGQPINDKYKQFALKSLELGNSGGPYRFINKAFCFATRKLLAATTPRLSASVSLLFPTIGPSFSDIAIWMNKYTNEYQYVCKSHAVWSDIKPLIDEHQPVIAQLCLGEKPMKMVHELAGIVGTSSIWPTMRPDLHAVVLHGYEGEAANGEPNTVIYVDPNGQTKFQSYEEFTKSASYLAQHPLLREALEISGYVPSQIIYRVQKSNDNDLLDSGD